MAAITKKRLYSARATATVRAAVVAADAATFTPDDLGTPDDVILDAREWEDVRIVADFAGTIGGAESVTVQLLRSVYQAAVPGRFWAPVGDPVVLTPNAANALFLTDGDDVAWRVDALTLGTATGVSLRATGGQIARRF